MAVAGNRANTIFPLCPTLVQSHCSPRFLGVVAKLICISIFSPFFGNLFLGVTLLNQNQLKSKLNSKLPMRYGPKIGMKGQSRPIIGA